MSDELRAYLTAWYTWATGDITDCTDYGFSSRYGLCASCPPELDAELISMFEADGLDLWYPFNDGDDHSYARDSRSYSMHKNPKRLEWVRSKINAA